MHYYNKQLRDIFIWNRKPKGEIGIEIEVEGGPWPEAPSNWESHNDGSLRNGGIEYVIRQPVRRDKVSEALNVLRKAMTDHNSQLNFSYRTSVHVHVNVQDMTVRQWCAFIAAFTVLEELLVDVVGPKRAGNKFCLRAKDADEALRAVRRGLREDNLPGQLNGDFKYASMNVLASVTHGTLEFRAMEGNMEVDNINNWVQVLGAIKDYAMKCTSPAQIADDLSLLGPHQWAREVLPEGNSITDKVLGAPNLVDAMYEGVRLVQDICYAVPWEDDPIGAVDPVPNDADIEHVQEFDRANMWGAQPAMRAQPLNVDEVHAMMFRAAAPRPRRNGF